MIDAVENALVTRFQQLLKFNDIWSSLYDIKKNLEKTMFEKACADLQIILTDRAKCDISG